MVYLGMTFAEVRFRNENFKDFASLIHFLLINVQTPKRSQTQKFLLFCSDELNTILSNIERTRTSFFEHRTNSKVFIYWSLCSKNAKVSMEGWCTKIHMPCERDLYGDIKKQRIFQKCLGKKLAHFRVHFDQGSPVPFPLA